MNLEHIQEALQAAGLDGWLFYDFHRRDNIAARILQIDPKRHISRRWFYYIPAKGIPQKLNHAIETWVLDHLPGNKHIYLEWQQQHELLKNLLGNAKKIAMQYSPNNAIPYVSIADAGTVELIRSFGIEVASSADLVSIFESHLNVSDINSHIKAGELMQKVKDETFAEIGTKIKNSENPTEYEIQVFMHNKMREYGLTWSDGPIVAINEHAADPHFEPTPENCFTMKKGDLVLLDLWARLEQQSSIYYDITWMGYIGTEIPEKLVSIFNVIRDARDSAYNLVVERFATKQPLHGWEVDDACRKVVIDAGYGQYFTHRTGHNIGEEVHGNGAHIDNLETKDERLLIPGTCFSIEPGIYIPDEKIGFRTEIDVLITNEGEPIIYGAVQDKMIEILK
jgi:Xaa-Pro aminopeptidase